jgi:Conserved TM helix
MWTQVEQALNESATQLMTSVAKLLPGMVAMLVVLVISGILAWLLAFLVRRSLRGINFDERTAAWGWSGLSDWAPSQSPTLLVSRLVAWFMIVVGFIVGFAAFDPELTSGLILDMARALPDILTALLLIVVGSVMARFLSRGVLIGAVNMNVEYARLLSLGVKWLVLVLTVAMALDHLGIGRRIVGLAFGILFGGIVLALALAVGLGSKDLVTRSLEREAGKSTHDSETPPFRHL